MRRKAVEGLRSAITIDPTVYVDDLVCGKRSDLQRHDLSAPAREVVQVRVHIGPNAPLLRQLSGQKDKPLLTLAD